VRKPNRRRTPRYTDRLKALHETVDRLVAEGRAIRGQMDELTTNETFRVRNILQERQSRQPSRLTFDPDDEQ
jgi:hypothetical protein